MKINELKKPAPRFISTLLILVCIIHVTAASGIETAGASDFATRIPAGNDDYIYDNAGILSSIKESAGRYLEEVKKDYAIEAFIEKGLLDQ